MPTYQYRCKSCEYEFEEIQKFSDEPLKECPSCHKDTLVRVIGGAGLVFKGSGFYLTDYKKESTSEKKSPASEKKPEPTADKKGESSSEKQSDSSSEKKSADTSPSESKSGEKKSSKTNKPASGGETGS